MTDLTVNLSKKINAPIEKVFDAWLDPEMLTRFILPDPSMSPPEVTTDAREGGRFEIIMQVGDEKIGFSQIYVQLRQARQHGVQAGLLVEPRVDDQVSLLSDHDVGIDVFEGVVFEGNFDSEKVGEKFLWHAVVPGR